MPARCSGDKLRQAMAAANITTTKLIKKSGVSESTVRRILANKDISTSDYTLDCLCQALGCSPFDLLRDEVIDTAVKQEADLAVSEVVADAVMEAVSVVSDSIAPDATPEDVAQAVPPIPVSMPPALDIPAYIDYIKATTAEHIATLKRSRDSWRRISIVLFILLMGTVAYFLWELFHPSKGLTSVLWEIYTTTSPTIHP